MLVRCAKPTLGFTTLSMRPGAKSLEHWSSNSWLSKSRTTASITTVRPSPRQATKGAVISSANPSANLRADRLQQRLWGYLSHSFLGSLWDFKGVPLRIVVARTWKAVLADRVLGQAAELGFYFLFALFPTLFCAGSILGLVARSAHQVLDRLLNYLALVIPTSALGAVLDTFNETTAAASGGKVTFGLIAAIWSASVGISAIQDTLNSVYKLNDTRSYFVARIYAIGLTIVLTVIGIFLLAALFGGDFVAALASRQISDEALATIAAVLSRVAGWSIAAALLALGFAVIYYWAPVWIYRRWRWLTPGAGLGILGWLLASLGFRVYLHFFNNYTITYGSLGAVIILLMWFYITGLMLLLGAEINSVIEEAATELGNHRVTLPPPYQNL